MPALRKEVILVGVSDLHLSHAAPSGRAEKGDDWYAVTARYLKQLADLCEKYGATPVYCGDIFHTWKEPAELVNFAIKHLPRGYAVPGQHDLPYHRYDLIEKSPYWTLVQAGSIENLPPDCPLVHLIGAGKVVYLHAFPWGHEIESLEKRRDDYEKEGQLLNGLNIAVVHSYVWLGSNSYEGAAKESHFRAYKSKLQGYDVSLFGDNHLGFLISQPASWTANNGAFIRRRQDEREYTPRVHLVCADGLVIPHFLDVSKDRWEDPDTELKVVNKEARKLLAILKESREKVVNFPDFVVTFMQKHQIDSEVYEAVLKLLEKEK